MRRNRAHEEDMSSFFLLHEVGDAHLRKPNGVREVDIEDLISIILRLILRLLTPRRIPNSWMGFRKRRRWEL